MTAYYNEIDPYCVEWLRNLIREGLIADGVVDDRDIRDVSPSDLDGFDQAHWFAGLGGWSRALRLAGWPDDTPVWTGSCPCQPYSAAGRGRGIADERHLWPHWFWLIEQCRPPVVFGEQVAAKAALGWYDLVSAGMEGAGYAIGAADICAAGVEAPHIRQRLWFVGHAELHGPSAFGQFSRTKDEGRLLEPEGSSASVVGLADADGRHPGAEREQRGGQHGQQPEDGGTVRVADAVRSRAKHRPGKGLGQEATSHGSDGSVPGQRLRLGVESASSFWSPADWLCCRDGKYRPVEPGTFPLAHGIPARVGKLRAYGNAIVPQVAAEFISAYLESRLT